MDDERRYIVTRKILEHVASPSLRHIRDPAIVGRLAKEIVEAVDRSGSPWTKWSGTREAVAKAAAALWIPTEDLVAFLNHLPGGRLTRTDVEQRLRALWEEPYSAYPNDELKEGCVALYAAEKAAGTEFIAIVGALGEHVEREEERLRQEREARYRQVREEERARVLGRFQAGADIGWTDIGRPGSIFSRRNGRLFRADQGKDKRWRLYRVESTEDAGKLVGTYLTRREASRALEKIAYEPEPRW